MVVRTGLLLVSMLALTRSGVSHRAPDCRFEKDVSGVANGTDIEDVRVRAGAGSLQIEGKAGLSTVQVRGHACASSRALLADLDVDVRASGSHARVQTLPEQTDLRGDEYARIDLVIEVPAGLDADIVDGSGSAMIDRLGRVTMEDGSGELTLTRIAGLDLHDGSGSVEVSDVAGDVRIEDGSGELRIRDVRGEVRLSDGSGGIHVERVGKDVRIIRDGSGSISVRDVEGDFTVEHDGSGGISYDGVRGKVDIPHRRGRR